MPTTRSIKRGAIPSPPWELAAAMPHVSLPTVPPQLVRIPHKISMWHNDVHGDCVTAEEAFAKACHQPEIFITDQEVETWAEAHGWFEGATLIEVLKAMQSGGFNENDHTYDDGSISAVNWHDAQNLKSALFHGPVKIGVGGNQLDALWHAHSGKDGWIATGFQPEAQDHCVSLCGYGTIGWLAKQLKSKAPPGLASEPGYALFTWDSIGVIDVPSMLAITHEAWLRTPTTIIV